jgi:pimeloyl-ACP methyl ester carboxylesterase
MLRELAQYAQWPVFYASVAAVDEALQLARIRCPRLVVYGADAESSVGDVPLPLAATIRARRAALERAGWQLAEVAGAGATLILDPTVLVPAVRIFLDSALPIRSLPRGNRHELT